MDDNKSDIEAVIDDHVKGEMKKITVKDDKEK